MESGISYIRLVKCQTNYFHFQQFADKMWWEIIPSFTIITVVGAIPALAGRAINRAIHDGNPVKRDYTQQSPHGVLYHFRDTQHSQPSFWQKYVKVRRLSLKESWRCCNGKLFRLTFREMEPFTRPTLWLTSTEKTEWRTCESCSSYICRPFNRQNFNVFEITWCCVNIKVFLLQRKVLSVMALHAARGKLIGVIGDEDTCVGFLLGGIGELNKSREPNFLVVDKNTPLQDIEDTVKSFMRRSDISIILINQNIAEMVK